MRCRPSTPTWIVPLDVTAQVRIRQADVERLHGVGDSFHRVVADQVASYPSFVERGGWTYLHDPVSGATAIDSALVTWQPVRAVIETTRRQQPAQLLVAPPLADRSATAQVALDVDIERSERFIVDRLAPEE